MKDKRFFRYMGAVVIVLLLLILPWLISPAPVFSQEEVPVFSADECPETSGGYVEADTGHQGSAGYLHCYYYKESADNKDLYKTKQLWMNYYSSPDAALEDLKEYYLNDDNLSKFSCDAYECDNFERALLEKTEDSYLGYFIGKYSDPHNYSLEQSFIYDNFSVYISAAGNQFSSIDEALSEMEELEVTAKQLADEPRETVTRQTSGDDCGCDEPTEVAADTEEDTAEDSAEDTVDDSPANDLAALITLFGTDPEQLSEWPGWADLSDTQKDNLINIIDRLDVILENQKQQEVIRQATEIVAEAVDNYHHVFNYFAIASIGEKYGDKAMQAAYDDIYVGTDFLGLGGLYVDKAYYGPISRSEIEDMIIFAGSDEDPEEVAQEIMEFYFSNEVTPEALLWQSYCEAYIDTAATLDTQHYEMMQQLRKDYQFFIDKGIYFDFSPGGRVDTALYNLWKDGIQCPEELP